MISLTLNVQKQPPGVDAWFLKSAKTNHMKDMSGFKSFFYNQPKNTNKSEPYF